MNSQFCSGSVIAESQTARLHECFDPSNIFKAVILGYINACAATVSLVQMNHLLFGVPLVPCMSSVDIQDT